MDGAFSRKRSLRKNDRKQFEVNSDSDSSESESDWGEIEK